MKQERGVVFGTRSVLAVLCLNKTQTRRLGGFRHLNSPAEGGPDRPRLVLMKGALATFGDSIPDDPCPIEITCPYGAPGDLMWVREPWRGPRALDGLKPTQLHDQHGLPLQYEADSARRNWDVRCYGVDAGRRRSSLHLPRCGARLVLRITDVRAERLHSITLQDVKAEGIQMPVAEWDEVGQTRLPTCEGSPYDPGKPLQRWTVRDHWVSYFAREWDKLHHKRAPWKINPWVWRICFRVHSLVTS